MLPAITDARLFATSFSGFGTAFGVKRRASSLKMAPHRPELLGERD